MKTLAQNVATNSRPTQRPSLAARVDRRWAGMTKAERSEEMKRRIAKRKGGNAEEKEAAERRARILKRLEGCSGTGSY